MVSGQRKEVLEGFGEFCNATRRALRPTSDVDLVKVN